MQNCLYSTEIELLSRCSFEIYIFFYLFAAKKRGEIQTIPIKIKPVLREI